MVGTRQLRQMIDGTGDTLQIKNPSVSPWSNSASARMAALMVAASPYNSIIMLAARQTSVQAISATTNPTSQRDPAIQRFIRQSIGARPTQPSNHCLDLSNR